MPVIQIILFGFAISTEVRNAQIAIFDPSKDVVTSSMKTQLQASPYFSIAEELSDYRQINDVFKEGRINMVIVFSENFAENLFHTGEAAIQIVADGTEPNQASILVAYASNILRQAINNEQLIMNNGQMTMNNENNPQLSIVNYQLLIENRMLYNPSMKGAFNFVPGVMAMILILICAMMTSIAIVREKEMGTMEVLLTSPLKPIYIILAKAVPYLALSIINLTTILLLSVYVLDVPVAGSLILLVFTSLLFIVLALSLGLLISTVVNTQLAAMLASGMVLMMPIMLLSGMMFPIESMPKILQWISTIVPARWYREAIQKIMIQGVGIKFVAKELLILTTMTVVLLVVSLKKFKVRLQ